MTIQSESKHGEAKPAGRRLPEGWRSVKLDEVCEEKTGTRNPRQNPSDSFQYVDISSIDNLRKRIVEARSILGANAPSRARQAIKTNDVILATTRPNLNAVARVPSELDSQICSTGFCVLRAKSELDPEFLFAFVQSESFVRTLSDLVKGALYPAVTDAQVRSQTMPLPPLAEQKRIAVILNEQMAAVERARTAAQAQQFLFDHLATSYLRQPLERDTLTRVPLRECLMEVTQGIGQSWQSFPVLGATRHGLAPAKEPVGKRPERYKPVEPGTIFYNPMRILIGSIAMIDEGEKAGITSPDYVVFKTKPGLLHPRWFYHWLRSHYGIAFIKTLARGAVRERMLFRRLAAAQISIPPWNAQVAIAEKLRAITRTKLTLQSELDTINKIPPQLLRRAFNGEL